MNNDKSESIKNFELTDEEVMADLAVLDRFRLGLIRLCRKYGVIIVGARHQVSRVTGDYMPAPNIGADITCDSLDGFRNMGHFALTANDIVPISPSAQLPLEKVLTIETRSPNDVVSAVRFANPVANVTCSRAGNTWFVYITL